MTVGWPVILGENDIVGSVGGSTLVVLPSHTAGGVVETEHYLHRVPSISYSFGLAVGVHRESSPMQPTLMPDVIVNYEGCLVGVVTFGAPASRELMKSLCPSDPRIVLELNRLWVHDCMPRNTESQFVARALKQLPPRIIVSYADTTRGHIGYIYRALSFNYAGWTDMDRKTARFHYIMPDNKHSRHGVIGGTIIHMGTERNKPKAKYWTVTGNHRERRDLRRLCQWPSLSWNEHPVPLEHKQVRIAQ